MGESIKRAGAGAIGVILAGGRGRRIGGEKAGVELGGRPLIAYPMAALEAAGLEPLVVAKSDSALPPLNCEVIRESDDLRHPLCGILAALEHAGSRALVALGCDMPFVPAALLAWLASRPEPLVAPSLAGRTQPFPARYERALLSGLQRALAGQCSMNGALDRLGPRLLAEDELAAFGDTSRICFNVNSAHDLARAEALLAAA